MRFRDKYGPAHISLGDTGADIELLQAALGMPVTGIWRDEDEARYCGFWATNDWAIIRKRSHEFPKFVIMI